MSEPEEVATRARIKRLAFPEDEARQIWLSMLLTAYAVVDAGVADGIGREQAQGRTLACHKGCGARLGILKNWLPKWRSTIPCCST